MVTKIKNKIIFINVQTAIRIKTLAVSQVLIVVLLERLQTTNINAKIAEIFKIQIKEYLVDHK